VRAGPYLPTNARACGTVLQRETMMIPWVMGCRGRFPTPPCVLSSSGRRGLLIGHLPSLPSHGDSSRDRAPVGLHVTLLPKTNQRSTRCRVRSAVRTGWLGSFESEIVCAARIFADAPALAQTLRMRESSDGEYAR
jgi:hypothetical protein